MFIRCTRDVKSPCLAILNCYKKKRVLNSVRFFSVSKYIGLGFVKISSMWLESRDCCTVHLKEQVHHFHVRFWISVFIFFSFLTCQMAWGEDSFGSCVLCRPLRLTLRLTLKIYLLLFFSAWSPCQQVHHYQYCSAPPIQDKTWLGPDRVEWGHRKMRRQW